MFILEDIVPQFASAAGHLSNNYQKPKQNFSNIVVLSLR